MYSRSLLLSSSERGLPVKLRVTMDSAPPKTATDDDQRRRQHTAGGADASANGPYVFCTGDTPTPWRLDGPARSIQTDASPSPATSDSITDYAWEVDGDNDFNDSVNTRSLM